MTWCRVRDEQGSAVVEGVFAVSLLMLAALAIVQGLLVMHVRTVVASAAQDGALAASRRNASIADGVSAADSVIGTAAAGPLAGWSTSGAVVGDTVQITVQGQVVSIVGFGNVGVSVTRGMRVESFRSQGSTP